MAVIDRERVQVVHAGSISVGTNIENSPVIPVDQRWHITRLIFADKGINDGMSGGFQVDFGSGGSREILASAYLTGETVIISINRTFTGNGSALFRYIRVNNAAVPKELFLMVEGFKRIGG